MKIDGRLVDRPDVPLARSFIIGVCEDPDCGPHIVAYDRNEQPICEIVISRRATPALIKALQALAYDKAVDQDFRG